MTLLIALILIRAYYLPDLLRADQGLSLLLEVNISVFSVPNFSCSD